MGRRRKYLKMNYKELHNNGLSDVDTGKSSESPQITGKSSKTSVPELDEECQDHEDELSILTEQERLLDIQLKKAEIEIKQRKLHELENQSLQSHSDTSPASNSIDSDNTGNSMQQRQQLNTHMPEDKKLEAAL